MAEINSVSDLVPLIQDLNRWRAHVQRLKAENFHATEVIEPTDPKAPPEEHRGRSADGSDTDPRRPHMGRARTRFSRNLSPEDTWPEEGERLLSQPDPRYVSRALLARPEGGFKPATQVNMLAAAWIQFQVHDWFGHDTKSGIFRELPAQDGVPGLRLEATRLDHCRTPKSPEPPAYLNTNTHWWDGSQIYGSDDETMRSLRVQEDGLLRAELRLVTHEDTGDVLLPRGGDGKPPELTGFTDNWWVGISMMHTLFALEHNVICAALRAKEPRFKGSDNGVDAQLLEHRLFDTARLVNTALMAKIHTTEWTPAMIDDHPIRIALLADWWGIPDEEFLSGSSVLMEGLESLAGAPLEDVFRELVSPTRENTKELLRKLGGKLHRPAAEDPDNRHEQAEAMRRVEEFLTGLASIVADRPPNRRQGTEQERFENGYPEGALYAMTEEFTAVYRMHPLIPDRQSILPLGVTPEDAEERHEAESVEFKYLLDNGARDYVEKHGLAKLFYSFGHTHPGLLSLDNYPRVLLELENRAIHEPLDLAAVDILRDRERGVPRYTRFRQRIRGDRIVTFEDLTGVDDDSIDKTERKRRKAAARRLEKVYKDIDDVDTMVGLFAEAPSDGFAFSKTAFYIFALMAPLRLRSDPFFTKEYGEKLYTPTGISWINGNTMTSVLARHFKGELGSALMNVKNAFEPWSGDPEQRRAWQKL